MTAPLWPWNGRWWQLTVRWWHGCAPDCRWSVLDSPFTSFLKTQKPISKHPAGCSVPIQARKQSESRPSGCVQSKSDEFWIQIGVGGLINNFEFLVAEYALNWSVVIASACISWMACCRSRDEATLRKFMKISITFSIMVKVFIPSPMEWTLINMLQV